MNHTDPTDTLSMSRKLTDNGGSAPIPPKIFAQPFRLALRKGDSDDVTWIEVRSLAGLRNVFEKVDSGELTEIDRFSSLEMQLWGMMAEHAGFMRIRGCASQLAAGIQPLGEAPAVLANDLSFLTGGDDLKALDVLNSMKSTLQNVPSTQQVETVVPECNHSFVKEDGVNLTTEGEDALIKLVLGSSHSVSKPKPGQKEEQVSAQAVAFQKESENAVQIFLNTPGPTLEERAAEVAALEDCVDRPVDMTPAEICKENAKPPTEEPKIVGGEAARIGHLIAVAARGLDTTEDKQVQEESEAAIQILESMIAGESLKGLKRQTQDIFEQYGVTMEDLRKLATEGEGRRRERLRRSLPANSYAEALKSRKRNLKKLMADLSEIDLRLMVESSQPEPEAKTDIHQVIRDEHRPEEDAEPTKPVYGKTDWPLKFTEDSDQTYGSDHYKAREVKPASDTPMWRARRGLDHDPAEDWHKAQEAKDDRPKDSGD